MTSLVGTTVSVLLCMAAGALAQYGGSSAGSSYASTYGAAAPVQYVASPAMQNVYPSVNLPLLGFPSYQGNATISATAVNASTLVAAASSATNYLATLPATPVSLNQFPYLYGTYADSNGVDYDASRDTQYNNSQQYALNTYRLSTSMGGQGPLNLSNPVAVAAASWWAPYPYQLAAWNDGYTTQAPSSTTAATAMAASSVLASPSVYYAAYGGNTAGLGVAGLGLSVPGYGPNVASVQPGLSYAYNVGATNAATSAAAVPAASYGSSSYGRRR